MANPDYKGIPTKLNERHRLMALMEATGMKDSEIRPRIGLTQVRMGVVRRSPVYQALLAKERHEVRERVLAKTTANFDIVNEVAKVAPHVFRRQMGLMEQEDDLAVAARATESLFKRLYPEKKEPTEHRITKLEVTVEQRDLALQAMREAGFSVPAIDVTPKKTRKRKQTIAVELPAPEPESDPDPLDAA